jgi:hypothetical protein
MYTRYLRRLVQNRRRLEFTFSILMTFTASGTFVQLVASTTNFFTVLTGLATALLGVVNTALTSKSPIAEWSELAAAWSKRCRPWNNLWLSVKNGETITLLQLQSELGNEVELEAKSGNFPHKKKLIRKIQGEVRHSLGL